MLQQAELWVHLIDDLLLASDLTMEDHTVHMNLFQASNMKGQIDPNLWVLSLFLLGTKLLVFLNYLS